MTEHVGISAVAAQAAVPPPSRVARLVIAWLLDTLFIVLTMWIGWAIWALITMRQGATPGKKLLKMKVVDKGTGVTISWAKYVFLRGLVGGLVACIPLVGIVLAFMPLWDRHNQSVYGKVSNTIVVDVG